TVSTELTTLDGKSDHAILRCYHPSFIGARLTFPLIRLKIQAHYSSGSLRLINSRVQIPWKPTILPRFLPSMLRNRSRAERLIPQVEHRTEALDNPARFDCGQRGPVWWRPCSPGC